METRGVTVQIAVGPVNDAPVAGDGSYITDEDTAVAVVAVLLKRTAASVAIGALSFCNRGIRIAFVS